MNYETEVRWKLAKMYSLISAGHATPGEMEAVDRKLAEAIAILSGPTKQPVLAEGEDAHG